MEDIKKLVRQHFPFETFNPGQEEAIIQIVEAVLSGAKHIVLGSPVATGKSAIATTVHRVLKHMRNSWRSTIVTSSKGLQNQYVTDDPSICDLKGRSNYPCQHGKGYYNTPDCRKHQAIGKCSKQAHCAYYRQRKEWSDKAPLRLTNTAFHIVAGETVLASDSTRANLVIIDECHELPKLLVEHATFKISLKECFYLEKCFGEWMMGSLAEFINTFMNYKSGVPFKTESALVESITRFENEIQEATVLLEAMEKDSQTKPDVVSGAKEEIENLLCNLNNMLAGGEWLIMDFSASESVEIKPVYAAQVAYSSMFYKCTQFLHMSATICGYEEYCSSLGIKREDAVFVDVKNPIPISNRPVVVLNHMKVSKDFDRQKLADMVDVIVDKHGKENGVIHTVSFKLAEEIKLHSRHSKRMIISNDRREILGALKKSNSGAIILSPSITTGYDFKGDLARWQIIAKVPFMNFFADPWIKLNMDRSPRWYSREAILSLVQASGRVCRGLTDKGVTYIADANFMFLFKQNHDLFPDWFIDALIIPRKK